jgi:hypothetical protein
MGDSLLGSLSGLLQADFSDFSMAEDDEFAVTLSRWPAGHWLPDRRFAQSNVMTLQVGRAACARRGA